MNILSVHKLRSILISVYAVGVLGMIFPLTREIFITLTPLCLLFSFSLLLYEQYFIVGNTPDRKILYFSILIFFFTVIIEITGVNTGYPFGEYIYGSALGLKIFETPLIIGLNWLLLIISSAALFEKVKSIALQALFASLSMLVVDVFIEQVCCKLDMWCWSQGVVPLQNYISWFAIAFIIHFIRVKLKISFRYGIAKWIYIVQAAFFVLLYLYFVVISSLLL